MKSKKYRALAGIIGCATAMGILIYFEIFFKAETKDLFAPILSLLSVGLMYFTKKLDDIYDKINAVRPIWRIITLNSEIEFFSLNKSKSVLSNVRYYSLIVDGNNKVSTINNADISKEPPQIYVTPNAVVKSEQVYEILETNTSISDNNSTNNKIFPFKSPFEKQKQIIIIESKTIYSEKTYFFEGGTLSGGLTMKYKPYTGEWDKSKKRIAKDYIKEINKQSKIEEPSSTTRTTTIPPA
ncbi:hypothetical protein ABHC39_05065 [Pediococcus acidilactici]|uniref:hypothetical protein n=1 Tax=Pediococcus acidilactici TaxID=1254 RepID=UPI00232BE8C0|nr:hypothetical protein [Pediococcus acidilactici]MDB8867698.1 hypothetical protein [Pediococcus acidilactici]